ncbi:hypothetical protein BDD12DRAFT_919849 [Trichophaea hybrida]|nr:hypothetical protein BDD12DRAFT_919849 [Trichophaea hybrida]
MHLKHCTPEPQEFVIIGVGSLLAQTRAITRTSKSLANSIELLASLPIHSASASASQLEAEIEATLSHMAMQISSLKSLADSPFLVPKSAAEPAKDWAESFESDLLGYRLQFDTVNRGREDGKWVVELFGGFDRGWERGGARLAVGKEEWEDLVEEVFEDALAERYSLDYGALEGMNVDAVMDCGVSDGNDVDAMAEDNEEDAEGEEYGEEEEEEEEEDWMVDGMTDGEEEEDEEEEEQVEEEDWMVDGMTDDAVEVLQILAEGYTAWFLGLAQDANEACIGRNNELDWSVIQLVKSQYAVSGLGSDVIGTTEVF